jgi:hypothetical protein
MAKRIVATQEDPVGDVLTPVELGLLLKLSAKNDKEMARRVYELCRRRAVRPLPSFKIGRCVRFDRAAVARWIADGMRNDVPKQA